MSSERIQVLIAVDHAGLRAGLRLLLEAQPDMVVVAEAETIEQARTLDADLRPDVVLMDLSLPIRPGNPDTVPARLETIRHIKAERPEAQVLTFTMQDDEGHLPAVLEAGGAEYVLIQAADAELLPAIRAVWRGGDHLHPEHVHLLLEGAPSAPASEDRRLNLTAHGLPLGQIKGERGSPPDRIADRPPLSAIEVIDHAPLPDEISRALHPSVKTMERRRVARHRYLTEKTTAEWKRANKILLEPDETLSTAVSKGTLV